MGLGERQIGVSLHTARLGRRDRVETLLKWSEYLAEEDRLLVEAVYRDGRTVRELGKLAGRPPHHVARRLARVIRRLRSPIFRFVALRDGALPPPAQPVARLVVLEGRSLREASSATRQPLHRVREHLVTTRSIAGVLAGRVER